ncbi:unnamed protein product [Cylindrotheca closterium]|uniref:CMP/dCMP-type deaminase domain-containing protein n=1 Tax=Cylindrotheca closterium TaxID=2856 RepID=A0AAD2FVU9_9STRA|nr:unnamed protein product [Cylindrotheca closterium]
MLKLFQKKVVMNDYGQLLQGFELHGWKPDDSLSQDENMMDLVMLVTRNSTLRQGSMACVFTDSKKNMISVANNRSLYTSNDSDVHAEIAALGQACMMGRTTKGATAYITMPPCKRCFAALVVAGVKKIVTRRVPPRLITDCAEKEGIEIVAVSHEGIQQQTGRINMLIYGDPNGKKRNRDDNNEESQTQKKTKES